MCVIIAAKVHLKNSNTKKWFLYKNRDRSYPPEYSVGYKTINDIDIVHIIDKDNDWTEGVNSNGLMIVNTALQNHDDKKDDGDQKGGKDDYVSKNGRILRKAFSQKTVDDAVKVLVDNLFDGNTFVSDGDNLTIIEVFLKREVDKVMMEKLAKEMGKDLTKDYVEVRRKLWERVSKEDYDIVVKKIKEDTFVVRTNHGEYIKDAGYIPVEGEGYISSQKRRKYIEKALRELKPITHPFQVLTMMKNQGNPEIDKNPQYRPLRVAPSNYNPDKDDPVYYTSSIIMCTPTGQIYMIPVDCIFKDYDISVMAKEKDVYFVVLPKNLPLFESKSKSMFSDEKVIIMEKTKRVNEKEQKLLDRYLQKVSVHEESTTTVDIALPPDKAAYDSPAGKEQKKKKESDDKKKKKELLFGDLNITGKNDSLKKS